MNFFKIKLNNEIRNLLIISIVFILFSKKIEKVYRETIIDNILSEVNSNKFIDIIFLILLIYLFYKIFKKRKAKPYISINEIITSIIVLLFYSYFRIIYPNDFKSFYAFDLIKYFDTLFIYFLSPIILLTLNLFNKKKQNEANNKIKLLKDTPINSSEDLLDRKYKAKKLYNEISSLNNDESVAIGITGEWGSGKTSFLKFIKEEFEKNDNFIIIDFNPWLNISLESIIKDFFKTLKNSLDSYGNDISKELKKYSDLTLSIHKNSFLEGLTKTVSFVSDSNLTEEFEKLNTLLKKINKQIIICIDDFDRLQANEIFEVLKLVRNSAGFDNFIYIVAYDKKYLEESLENHKIPNPKNFSEKIFLMEERLIPATSNQINQFLLHNLKTTFPECITEIDNFFKSFSILDYQYHQDESLKLPLKNIRDAKRYYNSFIFDFSMIKEEVSFYDYFYLKLLKFKYYDVYNLLFLYQKKFLKLDSNHHRNTQKKIFTLKVHNKSTNHGINMKNIDDSEIGVYIKGNLKIYNEDELFEINKLLNNLFGSNYENSNQPLSIAFPENYFKYFKDSLDENELSYEEFKNSFNLPYEQLKNKIVEWNNSGKLFQVKQKFYDTRNYLHPGNKDDFEKLIKIILFIANQDDVKIPLYGNGYDLSDLRNRIFGYKSISQKYYDDNLEEYKKFIISIFKKPSKPFFYESTFLNFLYNDYYIEEDLISRDSIKKLLIQHFENYCKENEKINFKFWNLYENCKLINWTEHTLEKKKKHIDEAKEIFKEFIKKDLDGFIIYLFKHFVKSTDENKYSIYPNITLDIFETKDKLIDYLESIKHNDSDLKKEFIEFVKKFIENGEDSTEYYFKYLM